MAKENKESEFMEKCCKYMKSKNFKKLGDVSPGNKGVVGKGLRGNTDLFEEGLRLCVGHIRQVKEKKH